MNSPNSVLNHFLRCLSAVSESFSIASSGYVSTIIGSWEETCLPPLRQVIPRHLPTPKLFGVLFLALEAETSSIPGFLFVDQQNQQRRSLVLVFFFLVPFCPFQPGFLAPSCLKEKFWTGVCRHLVGRWSMDMFQGSVSNRDTVERNQRGALELGNLGPFSAGHQTEPTW